MRKCKHCFFQIWYNKLIRLWIDTVQNDFSCNGRWSPGVHKPEEQ